MRRRRRLHVQPLEDRRLLAAAPLGATIEDTGEFLLGSVAVTPVLFESDGSRDADTQDWSAAEIDAMLAKIEEGVNWWAETLDTMSTVHSLEFVVDDTYATTPVSTSYEPIDNTSNTFRYYAGDFLEDLGYGDSPSFESAVHRFNHDQRTRLGTDWAFTIFVADASDDPDGQFASGGNFSTAFAYPGGLFIVMPSTRPASTVAHEMGHIFWARDEYPGGGSWTDTRGYYNAQNLNAFDNPTPGFVQQDSIMRAGVPLAEAYVDHVSPASTLAMVGWRDSDGDGIFDVADVPLRLEGVGTFDGASSTYHFRGAASAVPLRNQNSWGPQSDITLNRISRLQYSLDGGDWVTAATPDTQVAELDISVQLSEPFSEISWRVIDDTTGVTSPAITGTRDAAALGEVRLGGYGFIDGDENGSREATETMLSGTTVTVRHADGAPLFHGSVDPGTLSTGTISDPLPGVTLAAGGRTLDGRVAILESADAGNRQVFHAYDAQRARWIDEWSFKAALNAEFDQPAGEVTIEAIGLDEISYGRIEAYDASGNLLARTTSEELAAGETTQLRVEDPAGRIARIAAFGHAYTSVALGKLHFGTDGTFVTGPSGGWSVDNLAAGSYRVDVVPQRVIHEYDQPTRFVDVTTGSNQPLVFSAERVASPRHNTALGADVNGDGGVAAVDALVVINDLQRNGSRLLGPDETAGPHVDVNDDGAVTALDALKVINELGQLPAGGEGEAAADSKPESASQSAPDRSVPESKRYGATGSVAKSPVAPAAATDRVMSQWATTAEDDRSAELRGLAEGEAAGKTKPADLPAAAGQPDPHWRKTPRPSRPTGTGEPDTPTADTPNNLTLKVTSLADSAGGVR